MKHIVDIDTWERRDNYLFFQQHANSWISFTSEVDCTEAYNRSKASGRSFFVCYLYAITRAVNEVKELRYRKTRSGEVVWYDTVDVISPIAVPGKTFYTVRIPYHEDFETFYAEARRIITSIPADGDPYQANRDIEEQGDFDVFLLSAMPGLYFTSISYTMQEVGHALDYHLMNAGKAIVREGRRVMPIALSIDHAFTDGAHVTLFFEKVQKYLEELFPSRPNIG